MWGLEKIPHPWGYGVVAAVSCGFSVGGVFWAAHQGSPADGGRGGAIGTAIAFFALFVRPDYGLELYDERQNIAKKDQNFSELPKVDQIARKVEDIVAALRINSRGLTVQNLFIAAAGFVGTIC